MRLARREWLAHLAGQKVQRADYQHPFYEYGDTHMPQIVRPHWYVFEPFPELLTLPDGTQVLANDEKEKAAILEAATAPEESNVTPIRNKGGRPRKVV